MRRLVAAIAVLVACLGALYLSERLEISTLSNIKSGEKSLYCLISADEGFRKIDPELVEGRYYDTWKFKNGQAKNCYVE